MDELFHDESTVSLPYVQTGLYAYNNLCPITGYEIVAGADNFEFNGSPSDFKLTLKQSKA